MALWKFLRRNKEEERFILCLDGGGMRGVIPATLLAHLDTLLKKLGDTRPLWSHFDLISGTSTGGLLALALSAPYKERSLMNQNPSDPRSFNVDELAHLYINYGHIIFPKSNSFLQLNMIGQLFGEKYDDGPLNQVLLDTFSDTRMGEALTPSMVVTYDITRDRPFIISSYDTPTIMMRTAARATSAAPTYFSPVSLHNSQLVDGGVVANNPVLYAYKEAKRLYPNAKKFHILSLSTTTAPFRNESDDSPSGVIGWLDPIYKLYASSQMKTSDEIASSLSDVTYVRIHQQLEKKIRLDETRSESLSQLIHIAQQMYDSHLEVLTTYCNKLIQKPTR